LAKFFWQLFASYSTSNFVNNIAIAALSPLPSLFTVAAAPSQFSQL
jgi:hypothetical protein